MNLHDYTPQVAFPATGQNLGTAIGSTPSSFMSRREFGSGSMTPRRLTSAGCRRLDRRAGRSAQPLKPLRRYDPAMADVGDEATRRLVQAEGELLGDAVRPSPQPWDDDISLLEPHPGATQRRIPLGIGAA